MNARVVVWPAGSINMISLAIVVTSFCAVQVYAGWCVSALAIHSRHTTSIGPFAGWVIPDRCLKAHERSLCAGEVLKCVRPCLTGVCDETTGNCVIVDWGSGMDNSPQVTRLGCPLGHYGPDCTSECPVNCINRECDQDTGQCTQGCNPGFTGSDCTSVCINGYYGENCTVPCPEHCQNDTCTPQSGVCSNGCVDGFWGSDCSLGVELSRNTPEEKRTFYSHLSSEGKSLLLYVLTSRYEHALARAQFQIERAVQERNELQHLLQD